MVSFSKTPAMAGFAGKRNESAISESALLAQLACTPEAQPLWCRLVFLPLAARMRTRQCAKNPF